MLSNLSKSMVLDGIAASEAIDSSGEILDIKGLDISSLKDGTGVLNYEHRGDQSEGASSNDIIGHITFAKKIFSQDDCENDRELGYWNKVQLPFVYIQAELFNDEGHPGAVAAASLIRYYHHRKLPILMRYSIEGSTLDREGNKLKRAVAKRVAATIKPCNRSCISGVLSDGTIKEEKSRDALDELKRSERRLEGQFRSGYMDAYEPVITDPLAKMRSAIEDLREYNDMQKALSMGGFDVAPTSLQGGAVMMAENFGETEKRKKFIKNQAQAALRDWRGKGDLRIFIKHRLPDASGEFIEHFAKLVEDYQMKKFEDLELDLAKAVAGKLSTVQSRPVDALAGAPKPEKRGESKAKRASSLEAHHAKVQAAHSEDVEDLPEEQLGDQLLTFRGRALKANHGIEKTHFDERKGVLHTPRGSFKMYLPQHDKAPGALESFHNILNDPKTTQFHDYAVSNWLKVHKLLKAGKLPPEVIMHSTLFSQLSPNTPVPMQELMYAHLVDSMKHTGIDPRDPKFNRTKGDWMRRDHPTKLPAHSQSHFEDNPGVHLKTDSKTNGREAGSVGSFMLANNKFDSMSQYHGLHDSLVDLFQRHRHDARGAVAELMAHKDASNKWEDRRKRMIQSGKVDPGNYGAGPSVPGLAPKTGRYMAAMAGGGNVHVPDTHFTRYLFGLEKGTDARSIAYLKSQLWKPQNSHVLDAIDRFYATNHPAVQHMMDHPVFGKHFENREDAIFPAFWKNWMAIAEHERSRKMKTMAYNEATDHRPFWEAIKPFMKKSGSMTLPMQTAQLHAKWVDQFGEIPAQMLYYAHIVPQLLRASRHSEDMIVKFERIAEDMRKAMAGPVEPPLPAIAEPDTTGLHEFKDKHVKPGELELTAGPYKGSKLAYLGKDPVKGKHFARAATGEMHTLPYSQQGRAFKINSEPQTVVLPKFVDSTKHGDPMNKTFAQRALVHGIDMANRHSQIQGFDPEVPTMTSNKPGAGWYKNYAGRLGIVKPDINDSTLWQTNNDPALEQEYMGAQRGYSVPNREVLYPTMAKEFFGMGHYVPETAKFRHPHTGDEMSVQERARGAHNLETDSDDDARSLDNMHKTGDLDKMAMMDMIMGNNDRNQMNFMMRDQAPHAALIDNGLSLDYKAPLDMNQLWDSHHEMVPGHGHEYAGDHPIHPEAHNWLLGLNGQQFAQKMAENGVPPALIHEGSKRLLAMQLAATQSKLAEQNGEHAPLRRSAIGDVVDALNGYTNRWGMGGKDPNREKMATAKGGE